MNNLLVLEDCIDLHNLREGSIVTLRKLLEEGDYFDLAISLGEGQDNQEVYHIPLFASDSLGEAYKEIAKRFFSEGKKRFFAKYPGVDRLPALFDVGESNPITISSSEYHLTDLSRLQRHLTRDQLEKIYLRLPE